MKFKRAPVDNSPTHEGLMARIEEAKANVRKMKEHSPHLFVEWQVLQGAEANLKVAQENLEKAKKVWERLGNK